eukprot:scaffold800_cov111-Isochrysis_galbana.AAC.2
MTEASDGQFFFFFSTLSHRGGGGGGGRDATGVAPGAAAASRGALYTAGPSYEGLHASLPPSKRAGVRRERTCAGVSWSEPESAVTSATPSLRPATLIRATRISAALSALGKAGGTGCGAGLRREAAGACRAKATSAIIACLTARTRTRCRLFWNQTCTCRGVTPKYALQHVHVGRGGLPPVVVARGGRMGWRGVCEQLGGGGGGCVASVCRQAGCRLESRAIASSSEQPNQSRGRGVESSVGGADAQRVGWSGAVLRWVAEGLGEAWALGQGMPRQGVFGQGMFGQGVFGQGVFGQGMFGQGVFGQGMFGQGMLGQGMLGQGMLGQGMLGGGEGRVGAWPVVGQGRRRLACTCAAAARGVRDGRGVAGGQANRAAVGGGGAGAGQRARMRSRGRRGMLAAAMDARLGPGGAAPSPRHSPTGPRQGAWGEGQAGAGAGGGRAPNAPAPPPPVQPRAAALAAPRRRWALGPGRRRGDATCCSYRTPTADWSMCVCRTGGGSQRCNHMGWGGAGVRRGRRGGRGLAGYCGADRLPVR